MDRESVQKGSGFGRSIDSCGRRQGVSDKWEQVSSLEAPVLDVLAHLAPGLSVSWLRIDAALDHLLLLVLQEWGKRKELFCFSIYGKLHLFNESRENKTM